MVSTNKYLRHTLSIPNGIYEIGHVAHFNYWYLLFATHNTYLYFFVISVAIYANDVFHVCYKQPVFNSASVRTKDEAFNNSIEQINCTPTQTE